MKKLSAFFFRISTGCVALAGLVVFLLFSVLTLPAESARVEAYSQGLGSPDTSFFYNGKMLLQMADAYGEEGRAAFLKARWGFDLAFPLIYTFFYIISMSFLFKKGLRESSPLLYLNLTPLLALFFDLAENTATSMVMSTYPLRDTWGQALAPVFTPIKWVFVTVCMFLLLFGVLLWLKKAFLKK